MVSVVVTLPFQRVSQKWHDGLNSNLACPCSVRTQRRPASPRPPILLQDRRVLVLTGPSDCRESSIIAH